MARRTIRMLRLAVVSAALVATLAAPSLIAASQQASRGAAVHAAATSAGDAVLTKVEKLRSAINWSSF